MSINEKLNSEYPKLLATVQGNADESKKIKKVYEFIDLLNALVKEMELNGRTK
tara:strand:- start:1058 stop:1216 length:159 start_codon:yes stop_codon:yes gene_type:complete